MNKSLYFFSLILLITSCATPVKVKHLKSSEVVTLKFKVQYPSYKGMTKEKAKSFRKKYLENSIQNIYGSYLAPCKIRT